MSDVIYVRPVDPPVAPDAVEAMARQAGGCFDLHRVDWLRSFLSGDGARMLCWYRASDAESVRQALRQLGSDMTAVWPVTLVDDGIDRAELSEANVVAEFAFPRPLAVGDGPVEAALGAGALAERGIGFGVGFLAAGGTRMACVYRGRDAEDVRAALEAAQVTPERVWDCLALTPSRGDSATPPGQANRKPV
jgi:hypothetical protein